MWDNIMSISVNGQSQVPPGFRFHPTEEELLDYYLRKKVAFEKIDLDVIQDVDLNKLEPWEIQEKCRIGSTPQNDWYFFSHKDKKYPTGTRTNRATTTGFWKATGRDKAIYSNLSRIGMRKTLVFYKGRAPHGKKSDWIMHEYRLDDNTTIADKNVNVCNVMGDVKQEDGWVVCRVFKKKNYCNKTFGSPSTSSTISAVNQCEEETLEQMLHYIGAPYKRSVHQFPLDNDNRGLILKLPSLQESPNSCDRIPNCYQPIHVQMLDEEISRQGSVYQLEPESRILDWTTLDRLVASQLNGQSETSQPLSRFDHYESTLCCPINDQPQHSPSPSSSTRPYDANIDYQSECDIWSFAGSSNDQLYR